MSLWKSLTGLISDTEYRTPRIDSSTHTLQVLDYPHHEIHAGSHFEIVNVVELTSNDVRDFRIVTPATTKHAHLLFELLSEGETEYYLYEGSTIVTAGTAITPINNNRNSATAATVTVDYIDNTSVALADADTTVGTQLTHQTIGDGGQGGSSSRETELVLKENTTYTLRFVKIANGYISYRIYWYEHTAKN